MKPKPQYGSTWARRNRTRPGDDPLAGPRLEDLAVVEDPEPQHIILRIHEGKLVRAKAEKFLDRWEPAGVRPEYPCLCQRLTDRHEPNLKALLVLAVDLCEMRDGVKSAADWHPEASEADDSDMILNGLSCRCALNSIDARRLLNACQQFAELRAQRLNPQIVIYPGEKEDC